MVFNIKGQSTYFIVGILLSILGLIVSIGVYNQFTDSVEVSEVNEKLCTAKINAVSLETKDKGIQDDIINLLPQQINPFEFLKSCPTQKIIIDPNKLDCDQNVININPYDQQKNCIVDEILDLSRKCWKMNSEGFINGYNWACFTVSIGSVENKDPNELIRIRLKNYFNCDSENSNSNCKALQRDSFVSAQISSIYNSIIQSSRNLNIDKLKSCSNIDAEFENQNLIQVTESSVIFDSELYEKMYNDITINNNYKLLNSIINNSISDCDVSEIKSNFQSIHTSNEKLIKVKEEKNDIIFTNYCNSLIDQNCDNYDRFELTLQLENNFDERIYSDDIKRVSDVKMYNDYLSFSDIFRLNDPDMDNKLVLFNDEPINPGSAFQINYCDGLSSVSSGLIPMYSCGNKKHISISDELNNAGSRLSRDSTGGSCPIFSTISSVDRQTLDSGVFEALTNICESSSLL